MVALSGSMVASVEAVALKNVMTVGINQPTHIKWS